MFRLRFYLYQMIAILSCQAVSLDQSMDLSDIQGASASSEVIDRFAALEEAFERGDRQAFAAQLAQVDWTAYTADELADLTSMALRLDLASLTIDLVQTGKRLFPSHERLERLAQVLAPPTIRQVPAVVITGLDAS